VKSLAREVVPADLVRISAGDLVPADARLLEATELHLVEAALPGESLSVEKAALAQIFLGTSVVSSTGVAEVNATGSATQFGAIAVALAARRIATAFERGIRDFGMLISGGLGSRNAENFTAVYGTRLRQSGADGPTPSTKVDRDGSVRFRPSIRDPNRCDPSALAVTGQDNL